MIPRSQPQKMQCPKAHTTVACPWTWHNTVRADGSSPADLFYKRRQRQHLPVLNMQIYDNEFASLVNMRDNMHAEWIRYANRGTRPATMYKIGEKVLIRTSSAKDETHLQLSLHQVWWEIIHNRNRKWKGVHLIEQISPEDQTSSISRESHTKFNCTTHRHASQIEPSASTEGTRFASQSRASNHATTIAEPWEDHHRRPRTRQWGNRNNPCRSQRSRT